LDLIASPPDRQVIIALRGEAPTSTLALKSEETELPLFSTRELVEATKGKLPAALADHVQVVATLRPLTGEELTEIGKRLVVKRAAELDLADELIAALAEEASKSGRGARELEALIDRIP